MISCRQFLEALYTADNPHKVQSILRNSTVLEQKTLCKVLYSLANGRIPLVKKKFKRLPKNSVRLMQKYFRELSDKLMFNSVYRRKALGALALCYGPLLHKVFTY